MAHPLRTFHFLSGLLLALGSLTAQGGPDWSYCRVTARPTPSGPAPPAGRIRIQADELRGDTGRRLLFQGSVLLRSDQRELRADHVEVFDRPRRVTARGHLRVLDRDFLLEAGAAEIRLDEDRGRFNDVRYRLFARHAHGAADRVLHRGPVLRLENATYSSCDPGDRDWLIRASRLTLDRARGFGEARHARLYFKDVPLLYLPWLRFPLDDRRRSGFLFPTVGTSDSGGLELSTPLYWNMAPNRDLTVTPRIMARRGVLWRNELRYLGHHYRGRLQADYIERDRVTDDHRYLLRLHQTHRLGRHWRLDLHGDQVSDPAYFADFSNDLRLSSTTHLERRADLRYRTGHLDGLLRVQAYQTVDPDIAPEDRPYRRLPQLAVQGELPLGDGPFGLGLASELTRFRHPGRVQGDRLDLAPRLTAAWLSPAGFLKPALTWRYTRYDLDGDDVRRERSVPTFTLDSGLVFERDGGGSTQTLEPRLFYVYTPYEDQADLPVFDTSEPAFIFSSLFRANRFSGIDRIGDANQLTVALTTHRFDHRDGAERLSGGVGQIFYFRDRRVTLPDGAVETGRRSDYAAELALHPRGPWSARASLIAAADLSEARVATVRLSYRGGGGRIANLEHRFRQDEDIRQTDLSVAWPVARNWRLLGRWLYSHERGLDLDVLAGLEYESCCWKLRLVGRRYITGLEEQYNQSIYLQIVLKGLSAFGKGGDLLQQTIAGYRINDE